MKRRKKPTQPLIDSQFIIPRAQHCVSKTNISPNALKVLNRLNSAGFQAYLVGGSIRDLLLHKAPKDFDVATNATPQEIRALFRNGRIIGRRFKLVHILFNKEIIEVATFRGHETDDACQQQVNERGMVVRDNIYGSLDEDAWRRDFTINSLYYSVQDSSIIDFTGGVSDVHNKVIRMIGAPITRYTEDPVRMLRAIRFSAKLHFTLAEETAAPLLKVNRLIQHVSNSRLFDEVTKLYQCGEAKAAHELLIHYGLFFYLFPLTHSLFNGKYPIESLIAIALDNTDTRIRTNKPVTPAFILAVLLWFPMIHRAKQLQNSGMEPLPAIDKAMSLVLSEQNQTVAITKRYGQIIREIWLLQYRFSKRRGLHAFNLLQHPRFRAAYDFMALRALAGDEAMDIAQWWTTFQEVDEAEQTNMVTLINNDPKNQKPKRPKKKKPTPQ